MFQMMNEARIMVGLNGVATASVAYHEALAYARSRPQGRPVGAKDPTRRRSPSSSTPTCGACCCARRRSSRAACRCWWRAARLRGPGRARARARRRARRAGLLLDLLTPIAKTFPAEKGFEANALALQIHGGYGYSSEYLPEAWLRDQKLNSIHEGTTGIQGLDLLGRKVVAAGGAALRIFSEEVASTVARARAGGRGGGLVRSLERALEAVGELTMALGAMGMTGEVEQMLRHSVDYMEMFSIVVVAWQWLEQAAAAREGLARGGQEHELLRGQAVRGAVLDRHRGAARAAAGGLVPIGRGLVYPHAPGVVLTR